MYSSDDIRVTMQQFSYDIKCLDRQLPGEENETTSQTPFFWSRLEVTNHEMIHVTGTFTQEGRAALATLPFAITTAWLIWENVPSAWKWLFIPAAIFWMILFSTVFHEHKHYMINPHQTHAFYDERERTLFLELPSGKWIAVVPRGRVRDVFLEVMKELYGHRMLESMEKK